MPIGITPHLCRDLDDAGEVYPDVILEDGVEQVEAWTIELAGWRDRVAPVFSRPEPREIFGQLVASIG